jgi:hypothetical protein
MLKKIFYNIALAQRVELKSPLKHKTFPELLEAVVGYLVIIAVPLATIAIIYGAFQMLTAGGNMEKFQTAKKTIAYAVVGLVIVFVGWGIAQILKETL